MPVVLRVVDKFGGVISLARWAELARDSSYCNVGFEHTDQWAISTVWKGLILSCCPGQCSGRTQPFSTLIAFRDSKDHRSGLLYPSERLPQAWLMHATLLECLVRGAPLPDAEEHQGAVPEGVDLYEGLVPRRV